jgi:predicted nucleic-acid-binding Zn-ribbon protein
MYIETETVKTTYTRLSKMGQPHSYVRNKTVVILRCDNCDETFRRDLKKISQKRLSNNYFHVCSNCDAKRFAQRKGVERKKIWDMPASVELPVGKY